MCSSSSSRRRRAAAAAAAAVLMGHLLGLLEAGLSGCVSGSVTPKIIPRSPPAVKHRRADSQRPDTESSGRSLAFMRVLCLRRVALYFLYAAKCAINDESPASI